MAEGQVNLDKAEEIRPRSPFCQEPTLLSAFLFSFSFSFFPFFFFFLLGGGSTGV
jgi:hypothetical protein